MAGVAQGQTRSAPSPTPRPSTPRVSAQQTSLDLAEYGVRLEPDARLIIVMSALDAAGFDPTPAGKRLSAFRALVRKDQTNLDPELRERLKNFFERKKLPSPATAADQAARYVSLAYALSPPPLLDAPERSDDLPGGVLEVLDFAPLVREFYRKSGIDERLNSYLHAYQAEADRLRQPTTEMVRATLSYLHTRPIIVTTQRVRVKSTDKKKNAAARYETVEHDRRFFIVPDLLAAPGAVNFRVIADDYFAIVPEGTDPTSSELRRGYLQFVIDPLVLKFNKEIALHREQVKQLLAARAKANAEVSPDVLLVVSRSLVAAADARFLLAARFAEVTNLQRLRLQQARDDAARAAIAKTAAGAKAAITDEAIASLVEDYENGAVLDFYFADQLHDVEAAGFDIANFFGDIMAAFDPAREAKRLAEAVIARDRAAAARKAHPRYSLWLIDPEAEVRNAADDSGNVVLISQLTEVEKLLQTRNYETAETHLKALLLEHPGDPRLLFTLGQTASLWARDTTDDELQSQRLNRALANYRLAVAAAAPETDKALLSRAHEAMGRILAFLERNDEAMKEFDAAIKIGEVAGGAYQDAIAGKKKLAQP
ncbi:MAG: hypothetical protein DMF71_06230 [Acidobacteria bacterium]|nr:MAG: hypothetical protein DMF71_06230 [Acidobacteriota bacterium]